MLFRSKNLLSMMARSRATRLVCVHSSAPIARVKRLPQTTNPLKCTVMKASIPTTPNKVRMFSTEQSALSVLWDQKKKCQELFFKAAMQALQPIQDAQLKKMTSLINSDEIGSVKEEYLRIAEYMADHLMKYCALKNSALFQQLIDHPLHVEDIMKNSIDSLEQYIKRDVDIA